MLLEFAVNDGHGNQGTVASVETIVRRVTRERGGFGARPAMALVHWYDRWPGREEGPESRNSSRAAWHPEWATSVEGMLSPLAQYYDIASLSLRNALLYDDLRVVSGFEFSAFSNNWNHPNERGHRMMAEPMIYLIARVADGMARERAALRVAEAHARTHNGTAGAEGAAHLPPPPPPGGDELWLPQPLVEGNDSEMREPVCNFGEELHRLVRSAKGFTYLEDAEKPGFISNATGAVLELDVGQTFQAITLSYLRSWRPGMGQGTVTCADGCTCEEQKIDARSMIEVSVMVQHHFAVSAAPKVCALVMDVAFLPALVYSRALSVSLRAVHAAHRGRGAATAGWAPPVGGAWGDLQGDGRDGDWAQGCAAQRRFGRRDAHRHAARHFALRPIRVAAAARSAGGARAAGADAPHPRRCAGCAGDAAACERVCCECDCCCAAASSGAAAGARVGRAACTLNEAAPSLALLYTNIHTRFRLPGQRRRPRLA